MPFSDQIRQTMKEYSEAKGVSVNQIAKACGIAQASLSRFVNGSELRSGSLDKLMEFLGLEVAKKPTKKSAKGK